jgi:hypothetical protein
MAIVDSDAGQTETWTVGVAPVHGTLGGFSTAATSTGGMIIPTGLSYTPATGYVGADTFIINISDGISITTTTIIVAVQALPTLSSTLTPPAICDQTVFSYVPTSSATGATFAWYRAAVAGLSNPVASGSGNPNETLVNVTNSDVTATYVYTTSANGCSSNQNVAVTVHPTPRLSTTLYDTTCSGAAYTYVPVPTIPGTTFSWVRAAVAGITPATSSGTGTISETLSSIHGTATEVVYSFALSANGCTATRNLHVLIVPMPPTIGITTASPSAVCAGTLYQNFGAAVAPAAGITYHWSAVNADIFAVGTDHQYILVNFNNAGNAVIMLSVNDGNAHCSSLSTDTVSVSGSQPAGAVVLYYNYQFIYEDNTADSYQWGYDNVNTLDSTVIPGATFQSYPVSGPNFMDNYYWVITTKNGCRQKTYFNVPLAVASNNPGAAATLKVYPNPAGNVLYVAVTQSANAEVSLTDITGQTITTQSCKGGTIQFDITALPAGCYFVSCSENGVKVATGRFFKNQR